MAIIKLTPAAAHAVATNMKKAAMGLEVAEYDFFDEHDSQSKMMRQFEQRANEVRALITQYQALLEKDINELNTACQVIITADHVMGAFLKDTAGHHSVGGGGA